MPNNNCSCQQPVVLDFENQCIDCQAEEYLLALESQPVLEDLPF
jgi:hypothetical protein